MNPEPQSFTLSDVRAAACQIRNAGIEHLAPELNIINGARVVSYVKDNKAFIAVHKVAVKYSPKRVIMNDEKPNLAIEYQKLAKSQVSVMVGSEQEAGETQAQWARRMGLLPPWLGYENRFEYDGDTLGIARDIQPHNDVNTQRHTVARWEPKAPQLTERDVDVDFMSVPDQREFRHNDPEAYAAWVESLKEELGVHWDDGLVLKPFNQKGRKTKDMSWKAIDEDLDDMYNEEDTAE